MKSGLFVRPNLKLFLLGAVLIVVVEHLLSSGQPAETDLFLPATLSASPAGEDQLELLIDRAMEEPTSENFTLVSECLLRRGETKQAMQYLRRASMAAQLEEGE